ncbi:ribonuclease H [Trifolium pratense]|uniref:Ribonuclease H n=1 Tax=Trifolium pratense TaxID=57577 RepID=A0A2K3PNE9_TRIPR|nr:ribonuclease H [Trifolium pratense]
MVETFRNCLPPASNARLVDKYIKWNNNNYSCVILNVDGSCLGSPVRSGFGGITRNTFGHYLAGFSGFIPGSFDTLLTEMYAIYKGFLLAKDTSIDELVCYSDFLHCVMFLFITHLERGINVQISWLNSEHPQMPTSCSPKGVRDLLRNDTMRNFFLRK